MNLFLIRHAASEWNEQGLTQGCKDPKLSPKGNRQAEKLAIKLKDIKFSAIYSSPLTRAKDTAKYLAESKGIDVVYDDLLREIAFGAWEGLTYKQICCEYPQQIMLWENSPFDCVVPESENLPSVMERCISFLEYLKSTHSGEDTIAVVSHSQPIKCMLAYLIGLPYNRLHAFGLKNSAYARLRLNEQRAVLTELINPDEELDLEQ